MSCTASWYTSHLRWAYYIRYNVCYQSGKREPILQFQGIRGFFGDSACSRAVGEDIACRVQREVGVFDDDLLRGWIRRCEQPAVVGRVRGDGSPSRDAGAH